MFSDSLLLICHCKYLMRECSFRTIVSLLANGDVPARSYANLKACSLGGLNGCLACRNDEAAEPMQREMYSSSLKQRLPHRANKYSAFELHDARNKVSSPPYSD